MEEDFIKANPEWVKELQIMVTTKVSSSYIAPPLISLILIIHDMCD